ncbi:MAG: hypothetical protein EAX95_06550 [Candidatus Thorarchaeota archaeon]|nr:hypothetical protein [Candidatus Thorarchaeota archaeon]
MGEEEGKSKNKKKKDDYTELEFELGELEFEVKGQSKVVERMFYTLLEKLETGKLKAITAAVQELEDAVDFEDDEEGEEEEEETREEEALPDSDLEPADDSKPTEPPPEWDMLDTETPPETTPERELADE